MAFGDRKDKRVVFMRGLPAHIVALDGSWTLPCRVLDISQSGAKITLASMPEDIRLADFSLKFAASVTRRCRVARVDGNDIGLEFIQTTAKPARKAAV